jgi:hypothetical protein
MEHEANLLNVLRQANRETLHKLTHLVVNVECHTGAVDDYYLLHMQLPCLLPNAQKVCSFRLLFCRTFFTPMFFIQIFVK